MSLKNNIFGEFHRSIIMGRAHLNTIQSSLLSKFALELFPTQFTSIREEILVHVTILFHILLQFSTVVTVGAVHILSIMLFHVFYKISQKQDWFICRDERLNPNLESSKARTRLYQVSILVG